MVFTGIIIMEHIKKNTEFYHDGTHYLDSLRRRGKSDYPFEDEFYFTMPAISNQ